MTETPPAITTLRDLQRLTPARVGLGRSGASVPTAAWLGFALDHARARDAVHAPFDEVALAAQLGELGLRVDCVRSRVRDRHDYLVRPDLGRQLDPQALPGLQDCAGQGADVVLVVADGLSPQAVQQRVPSVLADLLPRLAAAGLTVGPAVVACGARVALGDQIGAALGARLVVVLIGERPGLSVPASLGAYLTYGPRPGRTDAERNCVSNIHAAGLSDQQAAQRIAWLVREALARQLTGVALKDDSLLEAAPSVSFDTAAAPLPRPG
ncbi:ethanolamine ammonia-lyase light chain [Rhodopseudomonas faecalis]|uniref:Ethanolamine ammonia-lyase small subunit n=1 Tax=Rhodopseudomonas faecalis TaxID=99655 RepID=A0A318TYZ9_9BRAD|nr:ethanolamine ammonia-lyase subunit EutC [Rhodopseudomonas faecalis]PYF04859.1 ethanolamine ammonia-lyase light chain [Rhodopseudomonas faecalis]